MIKPTTRSPRPCTGGKFVDDEFVRCSVAWPTNDPRIGWCASCECNLLEKKLDDATVRLEAIEAALTAPPRVT